MKDRKHSQEAREKLSAAAKARWAKRKAEEKQDESLVSPGISTETQQETLPIQSEEGFQDSLSDSGEGRREVSRESHPHSERSSEEKEEVKPVEEKEPYQFAVVPEPKKEEELASFHSALPEAPDRQCAGMYGAKQTLKCGCCFFWVKVEHAWDVGECYRYPHTEMKQDNKWCGEFKGKNL